MKKTVLLALSLFIIGMLVGSLIAPTQAQEPPPWLKRGADVTLVYGRETTKCQIAEVKDAFVRCGTGNTWLNLAIVTSVSQ